MGIPVPPAFYIDDLDTFEPMTDRENSDEYEECDVIVPDYTPTTLEETTALIETAMSEMGVATFEEFCDKHHATVDL